MGVTRPSKKCYLILDTESSICHYQQRRVLVSLAFEVVHIVNGRLRVAAGHYDVVRQPSDAQLDSLSEQVHGISLRDCQGKNSGPRSTEPVPGFRLNPSATCCSVCSMRWTNTIPRQSWGTSVGVFLIRPP